MSGPGLVAEKRKSAAAQHSDGLLILDELAQVDPRAAGECAYLLANEQGKARATRGGSPRPRQTRRLALQNMKKLQRTTATGGRQ